MRCILAKRAGAGVKSGIKSAWIGRLRCQVEILRAAAGRRPGRDEVADDACRHSRALRRDAGDTRVDDRIDLGPEVGNALLKVWLLRLLHRLISPGAARLSAPPASVALLLRRSGPVAAPARAGLRALRHRPAGRK